MLVASTQPRSVMLRTPAPAIAGDAHEQLGLGTPLFQDTELTPVIFRRSHAQKGLHELLVSATVIAALTGSTEFGAANSLFATAFGVLVDSTLLTIESIAEIEAGGIVCGYRLTLREPPITV